MIIMLIQELFTLNNKKFIKSYSDAEKLIECDGTQYAEAIDPIEFINERVYVETDIEIPKEPPEHREGYERT